MSENKIDVEAVAANIADQFYLMYPQAKNSLPKTAKQSLRGYCAANIRRALADAKASEAEENPAQA